MAIASSGDFLRANDPDVLRRLEAVGASTRRAQVTLTTAQLAGIADTPVEDV